MNIMTNEQTVVGIVYIKIKFRLTIRFRTQASGRRLVARMIDGGRMSSFLEWTATSRSGRIPAGKQVSRLEMRAKQNSKYKHEKVD